MYIFLIIGLLVVSLAIFIAPLRYKVWTALAIVIAGALFSSAKAIGILIEPSHELLLWSSTNMIFNIDSGSMDALSAIFVLIINITSISTLIYSKGYLSHELPHKSSVEISLHYLSIVVMYFSMLGVVCSDGGFSFLLFWELMTISSFILILFNAQRKEVMKASLTYLIMMHIGFILLLIGFVLLSNSCGSANFSDLATYFNSENPLPIFIIFLIGFGMKAGLFPMHIWLPKAYSAAPSHISALMSGALTKMGVYGIFRVVSYMEVTPTIRTAGIIILSMGIATGLWGIILASLQNDIKRILAYSSIENIGVIFIGLGVALIGKSSGSYLLAQCAICGALLHIINHTLFKSLLFFGAGNILSKVETTSLNELGGVAKSMPMTATLFIFGSVASCALPPLNGFVSEFLIYIGMFDSIASGKDVMFAVAGIGSLALIGGLVILSFTKMIGTALLGSPRTHAVAEAEEVDNISIAAMGIPLLGIFAIGFFPQYAIRVVMSVAGIFIPSSQIAIGTEMILSPALINVSRVAWILLFVIVALYLLKSRLQLNRTIAKGTTWGCGFTPTNTKMQYTGESFSEGLQSLSSSMTQNSGAHESIPKSEIFPSTHKFDVEHKDKIDSLFAAWWIDTLRIINKRIMSLRTGKINHYILFALAFLFLIFILSIFNLI